jgi:hypothetical protein
VGTFLIGIDDTDNCESQGTGRLARKLSAECRRRGLEPLGVTRHQFLVHPDIPYTSHNSGACVAVESTTGLEDLAFAFDFVAENAATGSDPGVCIVSARAVSKAVIEFGRSACVRVLSIADAIEAARANLIQLRGLGGTCQGVIGALGCVGLRAEGQTGRFIDLPGLRELPQRVDAGTFAKMGVAIRYQVDCHQRGCADVFETLGWVRPRLIDGKAVLIVQWSRQENAWIPVDRKDCKSSRRQAKR